MAWYNPFSWGKKKKEQGSAPPTAYGPRTVGEVAGGGDLLSKLKERIALKNIYPKGFWDTVSGPLAAPERAAYSQETAPAISSAASARGLGRSTVAVNRLALAKEGVERNIAERLANLRIREPELLETQIIPQAVSQLGGVVELGGQLGYQNAAQQMAEFKRQQDIRNENIERQNQEAASLQGLIGTTIGGIFGGPAGAILGSRLGDLTKSGSGTGGSWLPTEIDILKSVIQDKLAAQVNIARPGQVNPVGRGGYPNFPTKWGITNRQRPLFGTTY